MSVSSATKGYVEQASRWKTYTYIWPLLDHLAAMKPVDRERLDIGPDPMNEDALVISETTVIDLTVEMDGETVSVNSVVVPSALHQVPYGAVCHNSDDDMDRVMNAVRKIYHETTGRPPRQGQRFLDVLLATTREDYQKRLDEAVEALTSAIRDLANDPSVKWGEDRTWMTSMDSLYREVDRQQVAKRLRLYWLKRGVV